MFALIAAILFIIAIFVLANVHVWVFWLLLGLVALSLDLVFAWPLPIGTRVRRRVP